MPIIIKPQGYKGYKTNILAYQQPEGHLNVHKYRTGRFAIQCDFKY